MIGESLWGYPVERLMILLGLKPRSALLLKQARRLYAQTVQQARSEVFYRDWAVRDDKNGRFEMVTLHLFLVFDRLRLEPCADSHDDVARLGQFLSEIAVQDLEHNLREMGVGDLAVGKRVQTMVRQRYNHLELYRKLFAPEMSCPSTEVLETVMLFVYNSVDDEVIKAGAAHLINYVRMNQQSLSFQPITDLLVAPDFISPVAAETAS